MRTTPILTVVILLISLCGVAHSKPYSFIKADSLLKIAKQYVDIDLDSSILLSQKVIAQAKLEKDWITEAKAYINIGLCNDFGGKYPEAIVNHQIALEKFSKINDVKGMGIAANLIGIAYYHMNDYKQVAHYYGLAITYFEVADYKEGIAGVLNGLGVLYSDINDYSKSIDYYTQSLNLKRELHDSIGIVTSLLNIAHIEFENNKNFDQALTHFNEVEKICALKNNTRLLAPCYTGKSGLYLTLGDYTNAIDYAKKALAIDEKHDNKRGASLSHIALADAYYGDNKKQDALKELYQAEKIATEINAQSQLIDIYDKFTILFANQADYSKAYFYLQKKITLKEIVFSEENKRTIEDIKATYEIEKKNQKIILLGEENKVGLLEIENTKKTKYFLAIFTLLLLLIIGIVVSRYRLKNKVSKLLAQKNQELLVSNASKDRIFAIISHDLTGPIAAFETISSIIHNNMNDLPEERIKSLVKKMHDSSQDLQSLLMNLLNWAKSQQGYIRFKHEKFSLKPEIEKILSLYNFEIENKIKSVHVSVDIDLNSDREIIHLVLRNILQNAIKFSKSTQAKIDISTETHEDYAIIKITDNGIGMDESDVNKLFKIEEDMSQLGNSRNKGSGLGLYLCHELMTLLNGDLRVESTLGVGSTFFIKVHTNATENKNNIS